MPRSPAFFVLIALIAPSAPGAASTVTIKSSLDGAMQPAQFYLPPGAGPDEKGDAVPLLVALHTWSGGYNQAASWKPYLAEAKTRGWIAIHPHFRGPNKNPKACASDLAVHDILDAVAYARRHARVAPKRIYLVGASGGGHMAMVMAHRAPKLWAGVSAWVGISDLAAWHRQCKNAGRHYWRDVEASCGGPPGPATDAQYRKRSPLPHLAAAKGLPIDLNAGIHDGHTGSVPVSHTLRAFSVLAQANGLPHKKLTDDQIASIVAKQKVPKELAAERTDEPGRRRTILFRRTAGPARVTLFDGGHEIDTPTAIRWLADQKRR